VVVGPVKEEGLFPLVKVVEGVELRLGLGVGVVMMMIVMMMMMMVDTPWWQREETPHHQEQMFFLSPLLGRRWREKNI
jgi:hypothetical protein